MIDVFDSKKKRIVAKCKKLWMTKCLLGLFLVTMLTWVTVSARAEDNIQILPTDVEEPSVGCQFVGVRGEYATEVKEALALINKYRKEACDKHYINPSTGEKLESSDYIPIKWSNGLEQQARIRAAEATVYEDHDRPNGKGCFSLNMMGDADGGAEVLAWGGGGMTGAISLWYSEKEDWVKQNTNAVTGHYTSMINPYNRYVGLGYFTNSDAGGFANCGAGRFCGGEGLDETPLPAYKDCIQKIEVATSALSKLKPAIDTTYELGKTGMCALKYTYKSPEGTTSKVLALGNIVWNTNSNQVQVSQEGMVTVNAIGDFNVTFTYSGDYSGSITKKIKVRPCKSKILKVKAGKKKFTVKFKKVAGISGYQLQVYTFDWSRWKIIKKNYKVGKNVTSKTVKKLLSKTSYGIRIRTYKKVKGKTYYSAWSDEKSKTTK